MVREWPEEVSSSTLLCSWLTTRGLADVVEEIALADPSMKIRWSVAQMLSWYGFYGKELRGLLASIK